jgi:hypothetical protein
MKALEEKTDFQDNGINCLKPEVQMVVVLFLVGGGGVYYVVQVSSDVW